MWYVWNSPKLKTSAVYFLFPMHHIMIFFLNYLFVFGCAGSPLLCLGFLWLRQARAFFSVVHRLLIVVASLVVEHRLWNSGSGVVAPHVESPQTRGWTHVPCTGRWILIHCATRKVLASSLRKYMMFLQQNYNLSTTRKILPTKYIFF